MSVIIYGVNYNCDIINLNLCCKELKNLPVEIGNLINLQELNLEYKQLNSLPAEIYNLINLEKLICFNTRIGRRSIENFKKANPSCDVRYY
jgi:hypothetical protein